MYLMFSYRSFIFSIFLIHYAAGQSADVPACTGQIMGEANPNPANAEAGTSTGTSFVLLSTSMAIPCCGAISELSFAAENNGDLIFQVWRPNAGAYEVISESVISGITAGSTVTYTLPIPISVEQGDIFGWYSSGNPIVGFETDGSVAMGVSSSGGKTAVGGTNAWAGGVDGQRWHLGVTLSPNTAPYFTSFPTGVDAYADDPVGTVLTTLTVTDDDADDIASLSIAINPESTRFELAGNNVQLLDTFTEPGDYEVVLEVTDHCLQTSTATLTVNVPNTPSVIDSLPIATPYFLMEDTEMETLLHDLTFTDLDTDASCVTCSIDSIDPPSGSFQMKYQPGPPDNQNGVYFIPDKNDHLDHEKASFYWVYIICNDGYNNSEIQRLQVDIIPNDPNVPDIPASIDVSALSDAGDVVRTITATDASTHPDGLTDNLRFMMDCDGCPFAMLPNGDIYPKEDLNAHKTSPYVVNITVTDSYRGYTYNTVGPTQMTIHVTDINTPPVINTPTDFETKHILEHTDISAPLLGDRTPVYTASGTDADGDDLTWEMEFLDGKGAELFEFDADGNILPKQDLDYETLRREGLLTTTVCIKLYDGREYSELRTLYLTVDDVNEFPEFAQDLYAIETVEGEDGVTTNLDCPFFNVSDPDYSEAHTYDINCGTAGHFTMPGTTTTKCSTLIQQVLEYDLDNPGAAKEIVPCTVVVYDSGGQGGVRSASTLVNIHVHEDDDNWPVIIPSSMSYSLPNDSLAGTTFGSFAATDEDFLPEHRRITYTTDSNEVCVDPNGNFVLARDLTGIYAPVTRRFNLYATDEAGHTDVAEVALNIYDVPTTTTTTTTPSPIPPVYDNIGGFLDEIGNFVWMILAVLLGFVMLGLMAYMCFRCCMTPGACANACRGGRGGNCFGRGGRGGNCFGGNSRIGRWFRGRGRTRVTRVPQRGVSKAKPIRVAEKRPPARVMEKPKPIKFVEEPRPVRVVEEPPRPVKVVDEPKPVFKEPVKEEPKTKTSFFDRFKKKPEPTPKAVDEPKKFHFWAESDFPRNDKSVG